MAEGAAIAAGTEAAADTAAGGGAATAEPAVMVASLGTESSLGTTPNPPNTATSGCPIGGGIGLLNPGGAIGVLAPVPLPEPLPEPVPLAFLACASKPGGTGGVDLPRVVEEILCCRLEG